MKKTVSMLLALILALCGLAALAETEAAVFPESEAYVGTWYVDDYILEIVRTLDDESLFNCIVTRYDADGRTGVRWIYDSCTYDDVGRALSSLEIGRKFDVRYDEFGELLSSEPVYYEDGAAAFALNDDGTLTWTDFKETPGENERVFVKVEEDTENPVAAYEGEWVAGRAMLTIEELDDIIYCHINWGASYNESAVWDYEAMYDEVAGNLNTLENGVKSIVTYGEDGEVVSSEVEYDDGAAAFTLNGDGTLTWTDYKLTPGENEILFERVEYEDGFGDAE